MSTLTRKFVNFDDHPKKFGAFQKRIPGWFNSYREIFPCLLTLWYVLQMDYPCRNILCMVLMYQIVPEMIQCTCTSVSSWLQVKDRAILNHICREAIYEVLRKIVWSFYTTLHCRPAPLILSSSLAKNEKNRARRNYTAGRLRHLQNRSRIITWNRCYRM